MTWKPAMAVALISVLTLTACVTPPGGVPTQAVTRIVPTHTVTPRPTVAPATPRATAASATPRPTRTAVPTLTSGTPTTVGAARVTGIVDGDTIRVQIDGQTYTVRYIGMDTLETNDATEAKRKLAKAATAANRALVEGKTVRLEKDVSETDRYGRLLRYVYVGDVMVNAELVRLGHAVAKQYPPDTKYHALFEQLEAQAQAAGIGVWAPTHPVTLASAGLYAGPGVTYDEVGIAQKGAPLEIVARDASGEWLQLASGAWILAQYVENAPPILQVAAADAPVRLPRSTNLAAQIELTATPIPQAVESTAPPARLPTVASDVQIVALYRDGEKGPREPDEYVEIANTGGEPIDLTGWHLVSEAGGYDAGQVFAFPKGFMLQPQMHCRIYTNEDHPEWCGLNFRHGKNAIWSNSKPDAALLYDATDTLIATFQ